VAVYFKLVGQLLDFENQDLTRIDLNKLEKIFCAFDPNRQILELVDKVVNKFMEDSQVFKKTKIVMKVEEGTKTLFDYPTFFKTHVYKEEFKEILNEKISLFSHDIEILKNKISSLAP